MQFKIASAVDVSYIMDAIRTDTSLCGSINEQMFISFTNFFSLGRINSILSSWCAIRTLPECALTLSQVTTSKRCLFLLSEPSTPYWRYLWHIQLRRCSSYFASSASLPQFPQDVVECIQPSGGAVHRSCFPVLSIICDVE